MYYKTKTIEKVNTSASYIWKVITESLSIYSSSLHFVTTQKIKTNLCIEVFYITMIKIDNTARYPLKFIKGTPFERKELACALNYNFFKNIAQKFKSKDVSFDVFQKTLDDSCPFHQNVTVIKNKDKGGCLTIKVDDSGKNITGYNMLIPANSFSNEIPLTTADTFMHESAHYFSFMTNPKTVARIAKVYETGLYLKTQNFYNSVLYSKKSLAKPEISEKLDELLNTLQPKERIDFLQNSRYRLKDELMAYNEGAKYQDLIQDIHSDKICYKVDAMDCSDYNFETKIEILEEKLANEIKKYRKA